MSSTKVHKLVCGIAGLIASSSPREEREHVVMQMLMQLSHRGPNGSQVATVGDATFGCARLALVDISTASQPQVSRAGSLFVMNGEIFNYRSLGYYEQVDGRGDTGVAHAMVDSQPDWSQQLEGQYALAHYSASGGLTLSRDADGILPLYYWMEDGVIAFASEPAALAAAGVPLSLDIQSAYVSTTLWGSPSQLSVYAGVRQVPRGGAMSFKGEKMPEAYLKTVHYSATTRRGETTPQVVRERLREAVEIRIPAEVEYGVLLSGGLDSSAVAALASTSAKPPARCYGISFEDADLDERVYQEIVAEELGLDLLVIQPSASDLAEGFVRTVRAVGAPLLRTAPISTLLLGEAIATDKKKVVLSGEGADEYFGGYELYKVTNFRSRWSGSVTEDAIDFVDHLSHLPGERRSVELSYYQKYLGTADTDPFFSHRIRWTATARALARFIVDPTDGAFSVADALNQLEKDLPPDFGELSLLERTRLLECETFLQGSLLAQQSDRVLMHSGVEARYPFLDRSVKAAAVELEWDDLIGKDWNEKVLLKEAVRGIVPEVILARVKQAYAAPTTAVLRSSRGRETFPTLLRQLDEHQPRWLRHGAVAWLIGLLDSNRPLSTYDEIAILWLSSLAVLVAAGGDVK